MHEIHTKVRVLDSLNLAFKPNWFVFEGPITGMLSEGQAFLSKTADPESAGIEEGVAGISRLSSANRRRRLFPPDETRNSQLSAHLTAINCH